MSRGDRAQGDRAPQRQPHRLQFDRRPAGDQVRRGHVAQAVAALAEPQPPATDDAALDAGGPAGLDQLLDHRPGKRLPGPGPAARAQVGPAAQQRPEQRVAAEAAVELAEVVVDAEREAHPLQRQLQLRLAGLAGRRRSAAGPGAAIEPGSSGSARSATRPLPRLPGPHQDRAALDVEQPGGDAPLDPHHPVLAAVARQPVRRRRDGPRARGSPPEQVHVDQEGAAGDDVGLRFAARAAAAESACVRPQHRPPARPPPSRHRPAHLRRRRSPRSAPRRARKRGGLSQGSDPDRRTGSSSILAHPAAL